MKLSELRHSTSIILKWIVKWFYGIMYLVATMFFVGVFYDGYKGFVLFKSKPYFMLFMSIYSGVIYYYEFAIKRRKK